MEILSDSSIHKTFESQSLTETEDIKEFEESISESIGSSKSAQETVSGNKVSSREEKFEDSQSTLESKTSETVTSSSGHSHSSGTPEPDASSISSSPSSDARSGEETVDPRKHFLKRCIRAANQNSMKHSSMASESSPQKPFEADFCSNCIKAIKYGHQTKEGKWSSKYTETTCLVDPLIIKKLKFENLLHAMKEVTRKQEDVDDIQNCKVCRNWKSRVAETTFLTESIRHLKKQLTEWRLQQHLITMDSLNQIGDLASGLPKVSDPSQEVWEKLFKR